MSWVKLDDGFLTHPKALAAGKDGRALFIAGLLYTAGHLTDGRIDRTVLPVIAATAEVRARPAAARLVDVGLWEQDGDGWRIHDYHDWNPDAEEVTERRRKRAEAGRKGGQKSRPPGSKPEANGEATASESGKQTRSKPASQTEAKSNPVPVPTKEVNPSPNSHRRAKPATGEEGSETVVDQAIHLAANQYARQQMDAGQGKSMSGLANWWHQQHAETARERARELLQTHNLTASQLAGTLLGNANPGLLNATRKRPTEEPKRATPDTVKSFANAARQAIEHPHADHPGDET